ncbi:two-component-system connector protein YcgZ [Erwinia typographi]|uniref:Two-component-system connector protein YcgZ n=1 Tax=Erwinia typographi TaxID=371042 RepID=A0A0A3Z7T7_9GAMM|nr:regulatory protein YcgZ [Erwinia typographi]KGT95132.1 two-component-system connector protein YcgZ [Erwinia typographi]
MNQNGIAPGTASEITHYFSKASLPSQQETLGSIVVEILRSGKSLNRKMICTKLLRKLEHATSMEEEKHYQALIGMLFGR